MIDPIWAEWLNAAWPDLVRHAHLIVPPGLPPPAASGFTEPLWSEKHGQLHDWVLSLPDESRVHVHEYSDGTLVAHRDAMDPDHSVKNMIGHVLFETVVGRGLLLLGAALGVGCLVQSIGLKSHIASAVFPP